MSRIRPFLCSVIVSCGVALAMLAGPSVAGCSAVPHPDPLRAAIEINDRTAHELDAEIEAHTALALADLRRRQDACPPPPVEGRGACLTAATVAVMLQYGPEDARLRALQMFQHSAADRLSAAQQCRADGLDCEGAELALSAAPLAAARAGLSRLGAGGAGGAR